MLLEDIVKTRWRYLSLKIERTVNMKYVQLEERFAIIISKNFINFTSRNQLSFLQKISPPFNIGRKAEQLVIRIPRYLAAYPVWLGIAINWKSS